MKSDEFGNFIAGFAAGYEDDAAAYWLVRAAGSAYGVLAGVTGMAPPGEWKYLGDNEDSVIYIDVGTKFGLDIRGSCVHVDNSAARACAIHQ